MSDRTDQLEPTRLREVLGCFPSGVVALCSLVDGTPTGMAASSFTSVSLSPPLVSVGVQYTSATWPVLRQCPRLGVSVLAENQDALCRTLSLKHGDRFASVPWSAGNEGSVLIGNASAWLEGSVYTEVDAGDHTLVLLHVHQLDADLDTPPLVFHHSRFRRLAVADPISQGRSDHVLR